MEICQIHCKSPNNQVVYLAIVNFHCKFFKGKLNDRQELLRGLLPFTCQTRLGNPHLDPQGKKYYMTYWLGFVFCVKELHRIPEWTGNPRLEGTTVPLVWSSFPDQAGSSQSTW